MMKIFYFLLLSFSYTVIFASGNNIGDKKIIFPLLEGMTQASSISQEVIDLMGKTMPSNLKILDGYVEQEDALRLNAGKTAYFDKYIIITTPVATLKQNVTKKEFSILKNSIRKNFAVSTKKYNNAIREIDHIKIKVNKITPLGINYENNNSLSVLLLAAVKLSSDTGTDSVVKVTSLNYVLIKGRLLCIYVYKKYHTENDLAWVKQISKKLSDQIIATNQIEEILSDYHFKRFNADGHHKAKGAKFSIEMPTSWKWQEGNRPNIVQFFAAQGQQDIIPFAEIMVKNFPDSRRGIFADLTAQEASDPKTLQGIIPKGAKYICSGLTNLDGEKVVWFEFSKYSERAHNKITSHSLYYVIPDNGRTIFIVFAVGQKGYQSNSQAAFDKYRSLFQRIISSFVLTSKWK